MEYKGYYGKIEYDEEADILHGQVINIRDVVTFEGTTVDEVKQAFKDSVDDYLEFCAERGEEPDRPYSGKFVVRTDPELHKRIAIEAKEKGKSINALVNELLSKSLEMKGRSPVSIAARGGISEKDKKVIKKIMEKEE